MSYYTFSKIKRKNYMLGLQHFEAAEQRMFQSNRCLNLKKTKIHKTRPVSFELDPLFESCVCEFRYPPALCFGRFKDTKNLISEGNLSLVSLLLKYCST